MKIIYNGINNFKNNFDALTQSINQINVYIYNLIVNQHRSTQHTRQSKQSYTRFSFQFFIESFDVNIFNSSNKDEKFKVFDINYFYSDCFNTYNKDNYVIILTLQNKIWAKNLNAGTKYF